MSDDSEKKADPARVLVVDPREEAMADLAAFVLAGRPERVEDGILMMAPPEFRAAVRDTRSLLATLGMVAAPMAPPAELRAKLLESLSRRTPRRALVIIDMINDHLKPGSL